MQIGGTVTIQRAASSSGVSAYNLYLSSGACTAVGSAIANIPVSPGGGPTCFEGSSCAMITILQETAGQWVISRGMDGYENHEHAIIQVEGPGLVHFTRFETERSYDILRVGSASFSGTTVPADVELGARAAGDRVGLGLFGDDARMGAELPILQHFWRHLL